MSIFTADTSTQGIGGFTNTIVYNTKDDANIKMFSKSGIYNSANNEIKIFTNNIDALTIDTNQKVICDGSLITNLSWTNITGKPSIFPTDWTNVASKPTNFQSDWNTTIINKPDIFTKTETSNIFVTSNVLSSTSNTLYNNVNLTNYFTKTQESNIFVTSNVIQNNVGFIYYNNLANNLPFLLLLIFGLMIP